MINMDKSVKYTKKDAILDAASRLFYMDGVEATSFETIAGKCGVTAPLITYHFGTKNKLVEEIVNRLTAHVGEAILTKIYEKELKYDPKIGVVINILLIHKLFDEDEKARNFFLYFLNCGLEYNFIEGHRDYYAMLDRYYFFGLDRSKDELSLLSTSLLFVGWSLTYAYFTGRVDCTLEQLTDYMITAQFRLMRLPDDEITAVIGEGRRLFTLLDFKIGPYYEIS